MVETLFWGKKDEEAGMMNIWCLSGYKVIYPWYEKEAELMVCCEVKATLCNFKITDPTQESWLTGSLTAFGCTAK